MAGADGQEHDVEGPAKVAHRNVFADQDAGLENDAFIGHLLQPPVDHPLFELEIGNAVAQDPPILRGLFEHRDLWPARLSCWAAASPAGPLPMIATCFPLSRRGGLGNRPSPVKSRFR